MSGVSPLTSTSSPSILRGVLRQRLYVELRMIAQQIAASQMPDEMTQQIATWQRDFLAALRSSSDEQSVYNAYITLLQDLLCDPVTQAPLDAQSVLGNDGHTYGQMSLAVYVLSMPPAYRNRSPLHPDQEARFMTAPHPVVRYMIGWLQQHNALLYSQELARAYVQLLPQERPMDVEDRMALIIARQTELDRLATQQQRVSTQALEEKMMRNRTRDTQELARLHARLDRASDPLQAVRTEVREAQEEQRAATADLQDRISREMHAEFAPLSERITTFREQSTAELEALNEQGQRARARCEQMIQTLRTDVAHLLRDNEALKAQIASTSVQLTAEKKELIVLQQKIKETKIAIQEMKQRQSEGLLSAIASVAICAFATWGLGLALQGSTLGASIAPVKGGAMLNVNVLAKPF